MFSALLMPTTPIANDCYGTDLLLAIRCAAANVQSHAAIQEIVDLPEKPGKHGISGNTTKSLRINPAVFVTGTNE